MGNVHTAPLTPLIKTFLPCSLLQNSISPCSLPLLLPDVSLEVPVMSFPSAAVAWCNTRVSWVLRLDLVYGCTATDNM